jgi:hypothetical protein
LRRIELQGISLPPSQSSSYNKPSALLRFKKQREQQDLPMEEGMSMIGKTLGTFECISLLGKGGMGGVYKAKDQQRVKIERSHTVWVAAILCLFLGTLQSDRSFAKDTEITPEEVVAKHLKSIGKPEILAAIKSRAFIGTASAEFIQGLFAHLPIAQLPNGRSLIVSERRRLGIGLWFGTFDYPGEHFAFDGHDATVGYYDSYRKSSLGNFVTQYYGLLEEGLLGGTLSVDWPFGMDPISGPTASSGHSIPDISKLGPKTAGIPAHS